MNILIIGQNTKIAKLFSYFCDNIYMVVDSSVANFRVYQENTRYNPISTSTDVTKIKSVLKRANEINKWVEDYSIDVVFTNEKISMIAAKLSTLIYGNKVVLISTSHNSYAWINPFKVYCFTHLVNLCVDGYVALASFVKKKMLSYGYKEENILVLHNIIEPGLFERKHSYNINQSSLNLVYTASIYEGKGHHVLLGALNRLLDLEYDVHVDFIGEVLDHDYKTKLDDLINKHSLSDKVRFLGRLDNTKIRNMLCQYDIYVCPSLMEMSPYNVLEAKSAGLPIVATKVGGIPDIISDGVNGLLVTPNDSSSLFSALDKLAKNVSLRERIGITAFSEMTENAIIKHAETLNTFIGKLLVRK